MSPFESMTNRSCRSEPSFPQSATGTDSHRERRVRPNRVCALYWHRRTGRVSGSVPKQIRARSSCTRTGTTAVHVAGHPRSCLLPGHPAPRRHHCVSAGAAGRGLARACSCGLSGGPASPGQLLAALGKRGKCARPTHPASLWPGRTASAPPGWVGEMLGCKAVRAAADSEEGHDGVGCGCGRRCVGGGGGGGGGHEHRR